MKKKSNAKNAMKKSMNEQIEEKDLQKQLEEKEQIIRKLEFKVQKLQRNQEDYLKLNSGEGGMANFYKEKLQLEIKENEKAFDLFLDISNKMLKLTEMLFSPSQFSDDSSEVKGLLKLMGDANLSSSQMSSNGDDSSSFFQNMEVIQLQVEKRYEDLEIVCDNYHKNFLKIQKQNRDLEKRLNDSKKNHGDEVKIFKNEIKQARTEMQYLKDLLQKNEKERNYLLSRIEKVLDSRTRKEIEKLNRQDLMDYIKRLMFKITQLETTKTEVIKQNKKIKTTDYENYKKILNEIKEVKQMSRIGKSMC